MLLEIPMMSSRFSAAAERAGEPVHIHQPQIVSDKLSPRCRTYAFDGFDNFGRKERVTNNELAKVRLTVFRLNVHEELQRMYLYLRVSNE